MLTSLRQPSTLFLVTSLLLAACGQSDDQAPDQEAPKARKIAVTAALPERGAVTVVERSIGQLESLVIPEIAAEVEGRVVAGFVKTGESVSRGQLLAELEVEDYHIAIEAARAELGQLEALVENQRRTVERYTKLLSNSLISADRYDEAAAQLRVLDQQIRASRARLQQSERDLTKTRVLSPYQGVVDAELVSPGDFVKVGDPLFRIATVRRLRVRLPLPEMTASRISVGQPVELWTPMAPEVRVTSAISEIRPTIGVSNRAIDVFAIFDNPGTWQPGGSVNGEIVIARREDALLVPESAIVLRPAGTVVYVVEDDVARPRPVETGVYRNGQVEIRSGLTAEDQVIDSGAGFLTDGTPITVSAAQDG